MTAMSTAGASMLAHGVHYGMVAVGVAGLAGLLLPHALQRSASDAPRDAHEARVHELRHRAAAGALTRPTPPPTRVAVRRDGREAAYLLPVAMVGSAAAAGVHAAVAAPHLATVPLLGWFFAACALAQVSWAVLVLAAPSQRLLRAGVIGNGVLILLWAASRILGLEPVSGWDVACAAWEGGTVLACLTLVRAGRPVRVAAWPDWHPAAQAWLVAAAGGLVLLSTIGVAR